MMNFKSTDWLPRSIIIRQVVSADSAVYLHAIQALAAVALYSTLQQSCISW